MDIEHLPYSGRWYGAIWCTRCTGCGLSLADVTMGLMALCNLIAISLLGKYAFKLLKTTVHRNGRVLNTLFSQKTASKR